MLPRTAYGLLPTLLCNPLLRSISWGGDASNNLCADTLQSTLTGLLPALAHHSRQLWSLRHSCMFYSVNVD